MVYIFDPTTCEEPKKPTYRYSPIPKTVKYCCCSNPTDYEEDDNTTEGGSANPTVPEIPDKNDDNNSEGNTNVPEGGNTEVPPKVETRVTEREVTGTIRTRHYSYDGQKLFYDMLGQQAPAPSPVTEEWYLNNYVWSTGNLDGDPDSGELTVAGSTNEVPVGKYVTTETLTDGVVTDTKTEYVDYKVLYDVRGLKGYNLTGDLVNDIWSPRSTLPVEQGGIGNGSNDEQPDMEWFNRFVERDDTDGKQPATGFLKEGETVVTFLYENEDFFKEGTDSGLTIFDRD